MERWHTSLFGDPSPDGRVFRALFLRARSTLNPIVNHIDGPDSSPRTDDDGVRETLFLPPSRESGTGAAKHSAKFVFAIEMVIERIHHFSLRATRDPVPMFWFV